MRKEKKYHFIYKTICIKTNKYYLGMHSTDNLNDNYIGSGRNIRYSINTYGKENHITGIIEFCKTRKELIKREEEIVNLNEISNPNCINISIGGDSWKTLGASLSVEHKKKIGDANRGKVHTIKFKEDIRKRQLGTTASEETRRKMSESNRGYQSEESKLKISKANSGENNGMWGKTAADETRKKMSETQKLRWENVSDEDKLKRSKKISEAQIGKPKSEETKLKISNKLKGISQSKIQCPYCEKIGGLPQMKQWHFDNCKKIK